MNDALIRGAADGLPSYHWRKLPQVSFLSRQNTSFVATKVCLLLSRHNSVCRNKIYLSRQAYFCHDKIRVCLYKRFVATKIILVAAPANNTLFLSAITGVLRNPHGHAVLPKLQLVVQGKTNCTRRTLYLCVFVP